ncbi:MAG TPA: glycosyltransferase [Candidatus Enterocloster excrementipullorum]|uniref:Glycosyltransferase n=1 Tax=Candidatus Enterocloster excrementipullorum TaxID=2838559 RepID=A0A9D2SIM2_9FIRM|nr:glycosyltransferase [Candidatus Enterocloster excrementipullorum]
MKDVIIVGWLNKGKPADCGETMKNQLIVGKLEEMNIKCRQVDFKGWRRHPWVFIEFAWNLVMHRKSTLILSTSAQNVYFLMKAMKKIRWKQNTVHWVIGGSLGQKIRQGTYDANVINYMRHTLVESSYMAEQLKECNVDGVLYVPNFKPIRYYPTLPVRFPAGKMIRFVFMSRIMPEKGCDYILEAVCLLNEKGYSSMFSVDFYGKIAENYKAVFSRKTDRLSNVNYKGFLNLMENKGYDTLASYDLMLFPTYWKGEGFAGIFVDAFISGLPIIATDWAHNKAFLREKETALFIPVHNVCALADTMQACMDGRYNIQEMRSLCQKEAEKYNIDHVITEDLMKEIGVL